MLSIYGVRHDPVYLRRPSNTYCPHTDQIPTWILQFVCSHIPLILMPESVGCQFLLALPWQHQKHSKTMSNPKSPQVLYHSNPFNLTSSYPQLPLPIPVPPVSGTPWTPAWAPGRFSPAPTSGAGPRSPGRGASAPTCRAPRPWRRWSPCSPGRLGLGDRLGVGAGWGVEDVGVGWGWGFELAEGEPLGLLKWCAEGRPIAKASNCPIAAGQFFVRLVVNVFCLSCWAHFWRESLWGTIERKWFIFTHHSMTERTWYSLITILVGIRVWKEGSVMKVERGWGSGPGWAWFHCSPLVDHAGW